MILKIHSKNFTLTQLVFPAGRDGIWDSDIAKLHNERDGALICEKKAVKEKRQQGDKM